MAAPRIRTGRQEKDLTEDEARALITRLAGTRYPMMLYPFEFGWVALPELPPQEPGTPPDGPGLGLASYVIDRDGVVTVQSSLPIPVVTEMYVEARRAGRIVGYQIWPEPTEREPHR
jgi:hypothetical protein